MSPHPSAHPYARFLEKVAKPTRYTGGEHGARPKDWASVSARVCLAFPDIYDIGMSHLGYRILYKILNDDPRTLAERAYTPWIDMQQALHAHGQLLVSLESGRPLCDFDVVGFSLQFELTYTNILKMLDLGGIPLRSANRSDDDPLIVAGGPTATHMEPMAPFLDAVVVGDGEELAKEIALRWTEDKAAGLSREERLEHLAELSGVYVPSLYETATDPDTGFEVVTGVKTPRAPRVVERRLVEDLSRFPFPDAGPVGGPEAIFDRMSIEIARGCTEGCRFCQAGMIYRPVRERDPAEVMATVERAIASSGQDEVSLTALSTADVSCISPLIKRLVEKTAPQRVSLGVASLRAYGLAEDLLDDMRQVRASGLTFAPEAGTQRMRDVINKNVTEEQLLETAERVFSRGFDNMKLYFMIGLPTEQDEDVQGIVEVGRRALDVGKRVGRGRPRVTVSVSTHVPKPHTPFQWCAMDSLDQVHRKQELLRQAARGTRGLTLRVHECTASALEGVLARGDRSLAAVIERAYLNGARFDSWDDQLRMDVWEEALDHHGIEPRRFLGTIPVHARLPWDHLDIGLEEGFLAREYRKALKSRLSPPCGKVAGAFIHHTNVSDAASDERRLVCYDCGVACDLSAMRSERIAFLDKMGAQTPGERTRLPMVAPEVRNVRSPERYRPPQRSGPRVRYRLRFTKTGPVALLGHLDLIRELPRIVRRAGATLAYSQGFHPKPEMTFGPALSLGVASLDEYLDVKLIDPPPPDELMRRLNAAVPSGLGFLGVARLGQSAAKVSALIDGARYVVAIPTAVLEPLGGRAGLKAALERFDDTESIRVRRTIKGLGKMVDVKRYVRSIAVGGDAEFEAVSQAGLVGSFATLSIEVAISGSGSVKIAEVVEALFGDAELPFKAVRVALLAGGASPIDAARQPESILSAATA